MIAFRDFAPQSTNESGFRAADVYESFEGAVKRANDWIASAAVKVVNVETVVLPNMWLEDGTEDAAITTASGDFKTSIWHQFVRVWYEE